MQKKKKSNESPFTRDQEYSALIILICVIGAIAIVVGSIIKSLF